MADSDKKDEKDDIDDVPKAEEEVKDDKANDDNNADDDTKDDEKNSSEPVVPKRVKKEDPGDGLPKKTPDKIIFKWNKNFNTKEKCDTQHMLFLLSQSLELVRLRTIERNKYFNSIGRTDRFIAHLDNPQIITNFLNWHNEDKEKNKFDGPLYEKAEKLYMINNMISEIGGVKKGPATKIFHKLWKDVAILNTAWTKHPPPDLELENWGYTRFYKNETLLEDCTVDQMITLLSFVNPEPYPDTNFNEAKDTAPADKLIYKTYMQGVLEFMVLRPAKQSHLEKEPNWREKVIEFWKKEQIDGKKFEESSKKEMVKRMMNFVKDPSILNAKGKPANTLLRGGCNMVVKELPKIYVHGILEAAKAQKQAKENANNQEVQPDADDAKDNDDQ